LLSQGIVKSRKRRAATHTSMV